MSPIDQIAHTGYQSGAEAYERGRPEYPADAVEFLVGQFRIDTTKTLLDVAAGTGKLTRLLQRSHLRLIAVEPVEAMRRQMRAVLPRVAIVAGAAEALPVATGCVDAMFIAQAF